MTKPTSVLGDSEDWLKPALHFMLCGKISGKKYFFLSLPTKPDISFHLSILLVLTSGSYQFKAQFSISALLKVTVFDKSYSPGCQIKLTWAMEGEQKNKELKFYSLMVRKWDKINPSEGEVPVQERKLQKRHCKLTGGTGGLTGPGFFSWWEELSLEGCSPHHSFEDSSSVVAHIEAFFILPFGGAAVLAPPSAATCMWWRALTIHKQKCTKSPEKC